MELIDGEVRENEERGSKLNAGILGEVEEGRRSRLSKGKLRKEKKVRGNEGI